MNKLLIKNCVPAIIALTLTGLYSVIDGLFIGNAQGDNGLAAINIAWPVTALITAAGTGMGTGGSILYASFCGKKKQKAADSVLLQTQILFLITGIALLLVLGICKDGLLSLFGAKGIIFRLAEQYTKVILLGSLFQVVGAGVIPLLRSTGMAVSAMVVTIIGMIINMTANAIFLFIFHMGIRGTACGTVLAQSVVCMAGLFLIAGCCFIWRGNVSHDRFDLYEPAMSEVWRNKSNSSLCSHIVSGLSGTVFIARCRRGSFAIDEFCIWKRRSKGTSLHQKRCKVFTGRVKYPCICGSSI